MLCGQFYLPRYLDILGNHLTYRWTMASVWNGDVNLVHPLQIASQWKPILIYSKGPWKERTRWTDVSHVEAKEKHHHPWQQPLSEMETLVRYFSVPGDLVIDPCGGSFTTAVACRNPGRRFIGCDLDEACVRIGWHRLAEQKEQTATVPVAV
jgi:site-specific DNA-methyltransferase (adenine-specific)